MKFKTKKPTELDMLKQAAIDEHFEYQVEFNRFLRGQSDINKLGRRWQWVKHRLQKLSKHPDFLPNQAPSEKTKKVIYNII